MTTEIETIQDAAQIRDEYEIDAGHCYNADNELVRNTVKARLKKLDRALDEAQHWASEGAWGEVQMGEDEAVRHARQLN